MNTGDGEELDEAGWGEGSRYAAHLDRGWALLDKGDFVAAKTSAQQAQILRPDDPDAAVLLGAIALAEKNPEESLRWYDRAVELDSEYLEPYAAAAQVCLYDLDDPTRALRYCEEAVELEHVDPFEMLDLQLLACDCEISLSRDAAAKARLEQLQECGALMAAIEFEIPDPVPAPQTIDDPDRAAALAFLCFDGEGEPLEDEERMEQRQRALAFALRLARLWLDLRQPTMALELLGVAVQHNPDDADAWHVLAEAYLHCGQVRDACLASARTLRLDERIRTPGWTPTPAILQRRVLALLASAPDPELRELAELELPLAVRVQESPPIELVLEGLDPRATVVALGARHVSEGENGGDPDSELPVLTGIAVYVRNLLRFVRGPDHFDDELRFAVFDELSAFFRFDAQRRQALGLAPLPALIETRDDTTTANDDKAVGSSRNKRRRKRVSG